ncbi:methyltransferase domain-containing protein [Paraburkholderia caledonica]|uniref:SAM-dependent methyltransferase n=1 Tax=Paraburkholderia caledonica TaxID=134536 RepID=A0AB73II23_9BURK|nr:SAM-dependent methyltransferase [Paraburkholderia caledonica]
MISAAPGTRDDIAEGIDLEADHPFFSSWAHADRFIAAAVLPHAARWRGRRIQVVDFGGGQGLLAERCAQALRTQGVDVHACVVEANPVFAARARRRGLAAIETDIRCYAGAPADLALMRLVLHYNPAHAQSALLEHVRRHVINGGLFVLQFESGETPACELRNRIAAVCGEWTGTSPRFWADMPTMLHWLRNAGFDNVAMVDEPEYDSDMIAIVRDAWRRQRTVLTSAGVTETVFYRMCTDVVFAARRGGAPYDKGGRLTIKTSCPVVSATCTAPHAEHISAQRRKATQ